MQTSINCYSTEQTVIAWQIIMIIIIITVFVQRHKVVTSEALKSVSTSDRFETQIQNCDVSGFHPAPSHAYSARAVCRSVCCDVLKLARRSTNKTTMRTNNTSTKPASVSPCCTSHRVKTANIKKIHPQILNRPGINVKGNFCA